jgi:hypothetical protein
MSKKMNKSKAVSICVYALKHGQPAASNKYGITKQRVSEIFRCHKSTVFFERELAGEDGADRNFKELQKIFRRPL